MKKTLIISVFLAPLFSFAALTPCAPGDKFDLFTGKACVVVTTNTDYTGAYIASLIAQINALKAQLSALGGTYIPPVINSNPVVPTTGGIGSTPAPVNASANISLDSNQPITSLQITDPTNGQIIQAPILKFNITSANGPVYFRGTKINLNTIGTGQISAAYIYLGEKLVFAASNAYGTASTSNVYSVPASTIPANSTVTYTVKVDATGVTSNSISVAASLNGSDQTIVDSNGNIIPLTGNANGNTVTINN